MKHHHSHTKITSQRDMNDIAILFLRLFIGTILFLHLIGQMQTYDNVINQFPHIFGFDGATSFAIVAILEAIFAAMIIIGISVRFASSMMLIISALSITYDLLPDMVPTERAKLDFVYMGIYLTLVMGGGGYYSINIRRWFYVMHKRRK